MRLHSDNSNDRLPESVGKKPFRLNLENQETIIDKIYKVTQPVSINQPVVINIKQK